MNAAKKSLPIEKLLSWAYRDELPKRETGGSFGASGGSSWVDYGVSVDNWDREPGMPPALGDPHPDALLIEAAVNRLRPIAIDGVESAAYLAPECAAYIEAGDLILTRLTVNVTTYVTIHARMGNLPPWQAGPLKASRIIGPNGKTVIKGIDQNRHYGLGAHCPLEITPEPRELVSDRAVYVAWHTALRSLVTTLANQLAAHFALPPAVPECPWVAGIPQPTILPDLTKPAILRRQPVQRRRRVLDSAFGT